MGENQPMRKYQFFKILVGVYIVVFWVVVILALTKALDLVMK